MRTGLSLKYLWITVAGYSWSMVRWWVAVKTLAYRLRTKMPQQPLVIASRVEIEIPHGYIVRMRDPNAIRHD